MLPSDPFFRCRLVRDFSMREERIRAIAEVVEALFDNRLPPRDSALFLASAVSSWLSNGGDLARDHLRVSGVQGSHATPAAIWRRMQDEADNAIEMSQGSSSSG